MDTPRVRLGELLVRAGLITAPQLEEALAEQKRIGGRLGSLLVESGLVTETQVTQILSQQLSVPWVSLHHIDFSRELLNLVPLDLVEQYCLIPIYVRRVRGLGDALYIAMDDPTNAQALKDVAERSRLHVRAMIAPPSDIHAAIRVYYGVGPAPAVSPVTAAAETTALRNQRRDEEEDVPTGIHPRVVRATPPAAVRPHTEATQKDDLAVDELMAQEPSQRPPPVDQPRAPLPASAELSLSSSPRNANALPSSPGVPPPSRNPLPSSPGGSPPSRNPFPSSPGSPGAARPPSSPLSSRGEGPPSSRASREFGTDKRAGERARTMAGKGGGGMIALTLLDGTTIRLPGKGRAGKEPPASQDTPEETADPSAAGQTGGPGEEKLTARDLVAALRAASHGADASDILGENVRWEAMVAALLSVLLKKHLISDWEFVEEFKKG
jgi:type IV pilus assembly protein PilB